MSKGSYLDSAIISVLDLDKSISFYQNHIGFKVKEKSIWKGQDFELMWKLPQGSQATVCFLEASKDPVGRILLIKFHNNNQHLIRKSKPARSYGLFNINFYTSSIYENYDNLYNLGYDFWSKPKKHKFTSGVGSPIEVVFEGPDGVLINLVELDTTDVNTSIGQMRKFLDSFGRTSNGFTPIVTSASCMRNIDKATEFFTKVLKMEVIIDETLKSKEYREFQRVPENGETKIRFVKGEHMFGKIAMSEPINYEIDDLVPISVAPNIGYLSQLFSVQNIHEAENNCKKLGIEFYLNTITTDIPGYGNVKTFIIKNPGSDALQQIIEKQK